MAEQTVELAPGESKQVSFEAIPHEARTYRVSVDGLSGTFKAKSPININLIRTVAGTLTLVGYDGVKWMGQLLIATDMAIDTSGRDWGSALGTIELFSNYPFAFEAGPGYAIPIPLIQAGRRVLITGVARTPFTTPSGEVIDIWTATSVKYYPDYPASAYIFTLTKGSIGGIPVWTVTGNVPSFAIVAAFWEGTYHHAYLDKRVTGPISNWQYPVLLGLATECWCHPNPNASYVVQYKRELEINGWVLVGTS